MTISWNFEHFQYFHFETDFLENENVFQVESTKIENALFLYNTAIWETNARQIEWWVQNGPITKNGVLPVIHFFENFVSV